MPAAVAHALAPDGMVDGWALVDALARRYLQPPPQLHVDEWAARHRVLDRRTSAIDGAWRHRNAPHAVEIMRCLTDPDVEAVVLMMASQIAKTEIGLNWFGRQIQIDPGPLMWCTSTENQVKKLSRRRLDPMLDTAPLVSLVSQRKGRDSDRTTAQMRFVNGSLTIVTANSPSSLSSDPVRDLVFDEVDRYHPSAGPEGDAIALGLARQTTFREHGAKVLYISSPSIAGTSRIEQLYETGDQRLYHVPCLHCGELQPLEWESVAWDHDVPRQKAPETARYHCRACRAPWTDLERWRAVQPAAGARWIATKPFSGVASFHCSQLVSPFVRVAPLVAEWLAAAGKPEQQKAFVNTRLGRPFSVDANKAPDEIALETWDGYDVPECVCLLLAFVDVQDDRLEATIVGVDPDETLCVASHEVLLGNVLLEDVWADLDALLEARALRSDGQSIGLSAVGIDCGHEFERVCAWASRRRGRGAPRIYAMKGFGKGIDEPMVKARKASRARSGWRFYPNNVDRAKLEVIQRLNLTEGPGRFRFPARPCFSERYFAQIRSEKLKRRYVNGFPKLEWHLAGGARNEALDCLAGIVGLLQWLNPALDALARRNPKVSTAPGGLERRPQLALPDEPAPAPVPAAAPPAPRPAPRPRAVRVDGGGGAWYDAGGRRPGRVR